MNEYNVKDYTNKILLQMKGKSVKDTVTTGIVESEKKRMNIWQHDNDYNGIFT